MSVRSRNWIKFGALVALAFALGLLFAGLLDLPHRVTAQELPRGVPITQVSAPAIPGAGGLANLSDAFAAVAEAVTPSVVYIATQRTSRPQAANIPREMQRFFGSPQGPQFEEGTGSGFVVSADGYILTNNHVVEGADKVSVRLQDNREYTARVVGTDPNTDVAMLRIDAKGLRPLALGDSDKERVGEWVLAIGNPFGESLTFTVTSGIISAKGRALGQLSGTALRISDFIQTDAAINPGNSGGPLVNTRGEVIGMNSAIASQTGTNAGYGFAIPVNLIKLVMSQLIETGSVHRAAIGISIGEASAVDAEAVGLDSVRGVLVRDIPDESGPAARAGIKPGDVIVAVDGKPMYRVGQLQQEIGFRKPGDVVKVELARSGGERRTVNVALTAIDDGTAPATSDESVGDGESASAPVQPQSVPERLLGVSAETVTGEMATQLGLPAGLRGVIVTSVRPGGPAWTAQLLPPVQGLADIIVRVDNKAVRSEAELTAVLESAGAGKIVLLDVYRARRNNPVGRFVQRVRLSGER